MVKTKVTDIGFYNGLAYLHFNDETEFDTWNEKELAELWWNFCKENNLITIIKKEIEEDYVL